MSAVVGGVSPGGPLYSSGCIGGVSFVPA